MGDSTDICLFRALQYFLYGSDKDPIKSGATENEVITRALWFLSGTVVNWRRGLGAEHMITLFTDVAHDTNALVAQSPLVTPLIRR